MTISLRSIGFVFFSAVGAGALTAAGHREDWYLIIANAIGGGCTAGGIQCVFAALVEWGDA